MDITAIAVGVSIVSVLMPISLRLVDFIIHLVQKQPTSLGIRLTSSPAGGREDGGEGG